MSIKIIDISYLNRIGKFLSIAMADGLAKEKVMSFHRLNHLSYCIENEIEFTGTMYSYKNLDFSDIPLISSVQVVSDIEALQANCLLCEDELDLSVYHEIGVRIEQFKEYYDYETMKQYKDYVVY